MADQQRDDCTNADTENDGEFRIELPEPIKFSRPASRAGGADRANLPQKQHPRPIGMSAFAKVRPRDYAKCSWATDLNFAILAPS
ncbi:hypothetical protein GCT13_43750 [Paraburkholderia sp. CNPSo 3157]|uniref:Uncharacterized protein n=1 Tax=Paraburkholderia franconis TaxID=2654983 RepID=A0A7X1TLG3_9BURK|nr:hypothetical protein [Paraburkholderia franconis]MPW23473.1 hypothetical protein [Paraburkholderia franconis]